MYGIWSLLPCFCLFCHVSVLMLFFKFLNDVSYDFWVVCGCVFGGGCVHSHTTGQHLELLILDTDAACSMPLHSCL